MEARIDASARFKQFSLQRMTSAYVPISIDSFNAYCVLAKLSKLVVV
jgi:hypothetical protein